MISSSNWTARSFRSRAPARFGQAIGPGVGVRPLSIKLMKGFNGNAAIESSIHHIVLHRFSSSSSDAELGHPWA